VHDPRAPLWLRPECSACVCVLLHVQTATSVVRTDQHVLSTRNVTTSTRLLSVFVNNTSTIIDKREHVAVCFFVSVQQFTVFIYVISYLPNLCNEMGIS